MTTLARYLTVFAMVFLIPYWLGMLCRWFTYGLNESHDWMFWLACGAWASAALIRWSLRRGAKTA